MRATNYLSDRSCGGVRYIGGRSWGTCGRGRRGSGGGAFGGEVASQRGKEKKIERERDRERVMEVIIDGETHSG